MNYICVLNYIQKGSTVMVGKQEISLWWNTLVQYCKGANNAYSTAKPIKFVKK